ncbi:MULTISPECIES: MarR family winged helix-turn-helix transcriptional regulator [unclassified Schlesneria]|uniref:MarR family winged helix-turn-helix transcriptional regulator n=1 Tax=unclassified Schlesneria TaxID=2762017 RepID=UPI002EEC60CC
MKTIDDRAVDLQVVVQDILKQFQCVNATVANGPHLELHVQELRVIELLGQEGPRMMREIAEYLSLAVNSVTSIADNLEQKGLACRLRSDADRRVVKIELTPTGRQMYKSLTDTNLRLLRGMLGALTEDEQEIFMVLFRKIARAGRLQVQLLAGHD